MISEEEYQHGQAILGRPWKPRPKSHVFSYTGLIRCGECGASVTAEDKWQTICGVCKKKFASQNRERCPFCKTSMDNMSGKEVLHYVYYHCTKRKDPRCSQKSVRSEGLDQEIERELKRISIKQKYLKWAVDAVTEEDGKEKSLTKQLHSRAEREVTILKEELAETNRFIIKQELSGWTLMKKEEAIAERKRLEKQLGELENNASKEKSGGSLDAAMDTLRFASHAPYWFREGTVAQKKAIAETLGSNLTLRDRKLNISLAYPLPEIAHMIQIAPEISQGFEPKNNEGKKRGNESFEEKIPALLRSLNAVRTCAPTQLQPFSDLVKTFLHKWD